MNWQGLGWSSRGGRLGHPSDRQGMDSGECCLGWFSGETFSGNIFWGMFLADGCGLDCGVFVWGGGGLV